jgi:hypothetical protein
MTATVSSLLQVEPPWTSSDNKIVVGKDVLELLSTSMYIDPMSIYREYIQNAADAIDEARSNHILAQSTPGKVDIYIDEANRRVRIRDNGNGVEHDAFETRLTAFGASKKRGSGARGFRGVGRLAGIGYCQVLVFRSRATGESRVNELRWDCRKIKSILRSPEFKGELSDLVGQVVSRRRIDGRGWPEHFFEVELQGVVRHRNDTLLNRVAIQDYLAQTSPVGFSPTFGFGDRIVSEFGSHDVLKHVDIHIEGTKQIYRPHENSFEITCNLKDTFSEVEFIRIPAVDGGIGALGWILHHGYKGAIPEGTRFRGLRMRVGNIQVGDSGLLSELFTEPRFNAWSVGEVHVLDARVIPNGRRDQFEQSVHYLNILNHLAPIAREISLRCRRSSMRRNWVRQFERYKATAREKLAIVKQASLSLRRRSELLDEVRAIIAQMQQIANKPMLQMEVVRKLNPALCKLRSQLLQSMKKARRTSALAGLTRTEKRIYEEVFSLIYSSSQNQTAAKALIDRILNQIEQ